MRAVEYNRANIDKCWCGQCPVQSDSECAKELYQASLGSKELPPPGKLAGLYCATGRTPCHDITATNLCNCAACLVWSEHELASNHYCILGMAEDLGR